MGYADDFADRLVPDTYLNDEPIQLSYGDPAASVLVPERLFVRAQCIARAYELHLLPTIEIYRKTKLTCAQCERLLDETAFVATVSNDELLEAHLGRIQETVAACVRHPGRVLSIEGP